MKGSVFFLSLSVLFQFYNPTESGCIKSTTTLCPNCNKIVTNQVSPAMETSPPFESTEAATPGDGVLNGLSTRSRALTTTTKCINGICSGEINKSTILPAEVTTPNPVTPKCADGSCVIITIAPAPPTVPPTPPPTTMPTTTQCETMNWK